MNKNRFNKDEVSHELAQLYKEKKLIPFIGAGFSIPLSLPSWSLLIKQLGKKLGYDEDIFVELGSFQQLAEFVYDTNQKEWKKFLMTMTTEFNSKESNERRKKSHQHNALAELDFPTIYTTNYDIHIEQAYEDKKKNVNVISTYSDFLKLNNCDQTCNILKFHGSLEEQDSIILTETQYFQRMELEGALDQRLRADALANSFLFIGYSFSDMNIRYIFYKLHKLRNQVGNHSSDVMYSYIATFGMNEIQSNLLKKWDIKVIELDPSDKVKSITDLLKSLK